MENVYVANSHNNVGYKKMGTNDYIYPMKINVPLKKLGLGGILCIVWYRGKHNYTQKQTIQKVKLIHKIKYNLQVLQVQSQQFLYPCWFV